MANTFSDLWLLACKRDYNRKSEKGKEKCVQLLLTIFIVTFLSSFRYIVKTFFAYVDAIYKE